MVHFSASGPSGILGFKFISSGLKECEDYARKKAIAEGLEKGLEKGRAEGLEKGLEKGRAEGLEKGLEKGRAAGRDEGIAIVLKALSLLKEGLSIQEVCQETGLSEEIVSALK